jgi:RNA polymerase sigma-70 factor, ECF subfamily
MFFRRSEPAVSAEPLAAPDWAQVVQQIKLGDEAGMRELYAAFGRGVKLLFSRTLGPQDTDDKVHDTFVIVIKAIRDGDVREPDRLMSYVRTVVRRQIAGWIDTTVQNRRDQLEVDTSFVDARANPEQTAIGMQERALMRQLLRELSTRDVEVLTRFYLHEQTPRQICSDLRLTEKQFQLLKSRAKARFAELVKRKLRKQMRQPVVPFTSGPPNAEKEQ